MQAEDTHDLLGSDHQAAKNQAEPGPPPYESVMMSGYDGVGLFTSGVDLVRLTIIKYGSPNARTFAGTLKPGKLETGKTKS